MELGTNMTAKLEPYLLMSKSAKGAAAVKLIEDATSAAGVFVFAELLELSNIQELASSEQYARHYSLLQFFAYRTYQDYLQHKDALPSLNQAQTTKLKHLSLVSLAMESRKLPYSQLLQELEMPTIRELEDLIIDAIYLDIIRGKLDQKQQQFDVEYTVGRDVEPGKVEALLLSLQNWASTTSAVLATLDQKLAALTEDAVGSKAKREAYDQRYQTTLREVLDKQKEAKARQRAAAYPGQTGLTPAGIAERDRHRALEQQERERREKEAERKEEGEEGQDSMDVDVDEPAESGKGKKK